MADYRLWHDVERLTSEAESALREAALLAETVPAHVELAASLRCAAQRAALLHAASSCVARCHRIKLASDRFDGALRLTSETPNAPLE